MKKVLVIDDDLAILEALKIAVEIDSFQVRTLTSATNALQKITSFSPHLILLDLLLSGQDGRDIIRELKTNAATKHIPVILLSAHPSAQHAAIEAGADDFLAKPFDIEELLTLTRKHTQ